MKHLTAAGILFITFAASVRVISSAGKCYNYLEAELDIHA